MIEHGLLHRGSVACPHQKTLAHTRVPAALQINEFVPDHEAARQLEAEFVPSIKEELRAGLASPAGLFWSFGRKIDLREPHAVFGQLGAQPGVDPHLVIQGVNSSADTRLICDDAQEKPCVYQPTQRRSGSCED